MTDHAQDEKTEDATEKRKEDAKEQGQIARSKEFNMSIVMLAGSSGVIVFGQRMMQDVGQLAVHQFQFTRQDIFDPAVMMTHMNQSVMTLIYTLIPFFLVVIIAALAGPILLSGWSFSIKALHPKAERLSPMKGFKRIFALKALVELFKTLLKFFVVLIANVVIIYTQLPNLLTLDSGDGIVSVQSALSVLSWSYLALSATLLIIAAFDIPYQLWQHIQGLRMTKQEIRDEYRESEGRPEVKSHIRHMQRQIAKQRMMTEVPKADVVITNPTHFAVALRYDEKGSTAPIVVAKGKELIALQIRAIATHNTVPVIEAPALARAIYYSTKLNREIPQGLYVAVAQVLAYVYQLKRNKNNRGFKPNAMGDLPIPDELKRDS